ncbi:hypothetical protein LCGC14_2822080 [marine sediment metagenome]|uniref:Uncharacterized protein n=1 Tax=marine sediment metagenome TaxID=412755 RepID=A0A0F8Z3F5_9ZZZZ
MKIEREERPCFIPIVITLETVNEALMLGEALRAYITGRKERGFIYREETPKDKIAHGLLVTISRMGY